ncbi:glycoside hydrolase family 30 protein [Gracilibacillus sp. YIM 98692]|uniref:glycoside hydrolase family 30 protein n=1 Tax=Gracilibacillus sp. YIM 98692 TaxID=2663532 RepID=UPI0013D34B50|nr:glycoside hydrolase family 30 protein [Gracilibacillus sp. YIM 98692]
MNKKLLWLLAISLGFLLIGSISYAKVNNLATPNKENAQEININVDKKQQEIDGFGASGAWSLDPIGAEWSEENKDKLADLLFSQDKGIGLSMWRFNIGAGSEETDKEIVTDRFRRAESFKSGADEPYDWSKQSGQQWFLQAAKERGVEEFIAFVNSPPVWMTKNGHGQPDPNVGSTNLKEENVDDFAVFLADVLEHFEEEQLPFHYISPINEPTWDWNYAGQEGNRYNIEDIKKVITALHQEIENRGLETEIDAPEAVEYTSLLDDDIYASFTGSDSQYSSGNAGGAYPGKYREYIKELLGDSDIKEMVSNKISAHAYWSDLFTGEDRLIPLRESVRENMDRYDPNAKIWMSEYCVLGDHGHGRDLSMETALDVARLIHFDMVETQASAWQWWLAVSPYDYKDGLIYTDYSEQGDEETVIESKLLWALGNYSRFVRPGAYRVELEGANDKDGLMGSAYYQEEDDQLSVVLVNDSDETKPVHINTDNLPGNKGAIQFQPYVTSEEYDLESKNLFPAHKVFQVPPKSVVTLVAQ